MATRGHHETQRSRLGEPLRRGSSVAWFAGAGCSGRSTALPAGARTGVAFLGDLVATDLQTQRVRPGDCGDLL
jgi:hypothetical protein